MEENEWTDIPNGLMPLTVKKLDGTEEQNEFKPCSNPPAFWKQNIMVDWLCENYDDMENDDFNFVPFNLKSLNGEEPNEENFLAFPQQDIRTHIQMNKETQTTEEGMLFQTTGLEFTNANDFNNKIAMSVKADGDYTIQKILATMGGERRTVCVKPNNDIDWNCPEEITEKLNNSKFIRMVLATPAIFDNGWYPDWLEENNGYLEGTSPETTVKLQLKSAIIDRWQPVSGWDLENKCPKPVRRMVPAGSVYFFEVIDENAQELSKIWLKSVCGYNEGQKNICKEQKKKKEQDRKDGFGLALFGIYK